MYVCGESLNVYTQIMLGGYNNTPRLMYMLINAFSHEPKRVVFRVLVS